MKKIHKVLVTGGPGNVGRWVIKDLLEHGYEGINVAWNPSKPVT